MTNLFAILAISATFSVSPSFSIIGGEEIRISDAPYQVALETNGSLYCGGVILDKNTVLTTLPCTEYEEILVRAGSTNSQTGGWVSKVNKIYNHELSNNYWDYEISILKLETSLEYNSYVQPIILADKDFEIIAGMKVAATGWGVTENNGEEISKVLRRVELKILDQTLCTTNYFHPVTERMICATDTDKDACTGDAGGPLVVNQTLIGLISFGIECAHPMHPGVYTNIKEYLPWIKSKLELDTSLNSNLTVAKSERGIGVGKLILITMLLILIMAILVLFLLRRRYGRRVEEQGERLISLE